MIINLSSPNIQLVNSIPSELQQLMDIEKSNNLYVGEYSTEKHIELIKDENCLHLSIKRNDNVKLVGILLLVGLNDTSKVLEFRRIAISEKGKGYGREVIRLLKKLCFENLGFHRLWLDVFDDNKRAIALYESEGFILEGILRENVKAGAGFRSQRIYSMLEGEYWRR